MTPLSSNDLIRQTRKTLQELEATQNKKFLKKASPKSLIKSRSKFIDDLLKNYWINKGLDVENGISLIAVGGYGRKELFPYSDIDILILCPEDNKHYTKIETFLTDIWDTGLHIGHSVRTLKNCLQSATQDLSIYTNLLDGRTVAGSKKNLAHLYSLMKEAQLWPANAFIDKRFEEQLERHQKYQDTIYWLEPDIKQCPGGLRDIHTIHWITRHLDFKNLLPQKIFNPVEEETLLKTQELLWRIRLGLHFTAKKKQDQLLFDHQISLAKNFGFSAYNINHAVEQFMHIYFKNAKEIALFNNLFMAICEEKFIKKHSKIYHCHSHESGDPSIIDGLILEDNLIGFKDNNVLEKTPELLLTLFSLMAKNPEIKGLKAETIRHARTYLKTHEFSYQKLKKHRHLFLKILEKNSQTYLVLQRMNDLGVLSAYLPDFKHIVGLMQYDLFHIYTVDQHTLFVIKNIQKFTKNKKNSPYPLCNELMEKIPNICVLYLSAIFHDIGKGLGGKHADIGAIMALKFCHAHKLETADAKLVSWLVKHHLLMSQTAERHDIQNHAVISHFGSQVKNIETLNYLYLLTVADIIATNKTLWNSWKASLLLKLYEKTKDYFLSQLKVTTQKSLVETKKSMAEAALLALGHRREKIDDLWQKLGDNYFIRENENTIIWQVSAILATQKLPLILLQTDPAIGATEIFVYTEDRDNLFATTTAVLDRCLLNIVEAHIITSDHGFSLDTYIVLNEHHKPILKKSRLDKIYQVLLKYHSEPYTLPYYNQRRIPLHYRHFSRQTKVKFKNAKIEGSYTEVIVTASDRPGLLARIGRAFMEADIRLHHAKIITAGIMWKIFFTSQTRKII